MRARAGIRQSLHSFPGVIPRKRPNYRAKGWRRASTAPRGCRPRCIHQLLRRYLSAVSRRRRRRDMRHRQITYPTLN